MEINLSLSKLSISFEKKGLKTFWGNLNGVLLPSLMIVLFVISIFTFYHYFQNGLGLAYNDARSHLDIGRRVVEGLKPGFAQLGSVWLPLPHVLMIATVWNDFMWHSGLAGALASMVSYVVTGYVIFKILDELNVSLLGKIVGVLVFALNLNILYLQSTAMTELLLLATMTIGVYQMILWHKYDNIMYLVHSSFWVMLSTLVRYDGWFLLFWVAVLVVTRGFRKGGYKKGEGLFVFFCTLGGLGVFLWLMWNALIFKDPLFFAFGDFSAHAQQTQLDEAGVLQTKGNIWLSIKMYWYALVLNSILFNVILGFIGQVVLWYDKKISSEVKIAASALLAPLVFNILALYLGHSVLFIQGISGDTWFNVRYGVMLMPTIAVFIGYLFSKLTNQLKFVTLGLLVLTTFFSYTTVDAVTIDDALVGSSQKNVSEVAGWLAENAANEEGFVLISAASHDAIIFSSGMPMKRFIHEGTGTYWDSATTAPDRWAKWIVMRTHDENDLTYRLVSKTDALDKYELEQSLPFADVYVLKDEFWSTVNTKPILPKQR